MSSVYLAGLGPFLYHLYDDRGLDVLGSSRELLEYAGTGKRKGKIHITNLVEEQISLSKKTDDVI